MALYHFTLKSDKRPGSKAQISALEHADYINRKGKYKDQNSQKGRDLDNVIVSARARSGEKAHTLLLYANTNEKILDTDKGYAVTGNPSEDTISIALMLAQKSTNSPLEIFGSNVFRAKCIHAAALADLPITFADEKMQSIYNAKKQENLDERDRFRQQGGRIIRAKCLPKPHPNEAQFRMSAAPTAAAIPTMRELPKLTMAGDRSGDASVLLSSDARDQLGYERTARDPAVRWDLSDGRRRRANIIAERILKSAAENKSAVAAAGHAAYINRENQFAERGDCLYRSHRLPKWAKDSPAVFFRAADRYSPKDVDRYKELEFALQNELTLEQNLEIIQRFIDENLPDHYYAYAVHDKIGAMSDGTRNPHVHLMICPRVIDEIEEKKERKRSDYFRYPLRRNAKDQSDEAKRTHGAHMARKWSEKAYTAHLRASYEEIVNSTLEKYGFRARVDRRSLKEQEEAARRDGDLVLAALLHRIPESHIDKNLIMDENSPAVAQIKNYRKHKNEYRDLLFAAELAAHDVEGEKQREQTARLKKIIGKIINSNEYNENDAENPALKQSRETFIKAVHAYDHLRRMLVTSEAAREDAMLEYMTPEEKETYQEHKKLREEIAHWTAFKEDLKVPEDATDDERAAYRQIVPALEEKIAHLTARKDVLQEHIDAIDACLSNPDIQKQIQHITHETLKINTEIRKKLKAAARDVEQQIRAMEDILSSDTRAENTQGVYSTRELYVIMQRRFYGHKKQVDRLNEQLAEARKKVISHDRAIRMASDIYTNGALKALRENMRKLKKQEGYLQNDRAAYERDLDAFERRPLPPATDTTVLTQYRAAQSALAARKDALARKSRDMAAKRKALEEQKAQLAAKIDSPEGKKKIKEISLGILRKNAPLQKHCSELQAHLEQAKAEMSEAKAHMETLAIAVKKDMRDTRRYRVSPSDSGTPNGGTSQPAACGKPTSGASGTGTIRNMPQKEKSTAQQRKLPDAPSKIAAAIGGNAHYASLVATLRTDDPALKTWTLMSEAAKDEEANKRYYQNL